MRDTVAWLIDPSLKKRVSRVGFKPRKNDDARHWLICRILLGTGLVVPRLTDYKTPIHSEDELSVSRPVCMS